MIVLGNNSYLVESLSELPNFSRANELYLDFETTSWSPSEAAFQPYLGHSIAGAAVTADDCPDAYYVPVRHHFTDNRRHSDNVDEKQFRSWLQDVLQCDNWINANVKFDAHFAAEEGAVFTGGLRCLTTAAKLINSDMLYSGGYGLKRLARDWLGEPDWNDQVADYLRDVKLPRNRKAKDYGIVPADIMGAYACKDVLISRKLWAFIQHKLPEESKQIFDIEMKLTPVLFDMERRGLCVNVEQLERMEGNLMLELAQIEEWLHTNLKIAINPAKSADCYELLCNYWGLPVLKYKDDNEDNNPSFDKDTLLQYQLHPLVADDPVKKPVIEILKYYRKRHTLLTTFVQPYLLHQVDGILHPSYNQSIKSGRLSCKRPNAQQLSPEAKELIWPHEGMCWYSGDLSQVEFRLIGDYTNTYDVINRLNEDPDTDFHLWVAEMCGIPRKPAKNVNFAAGYGAGKTRIVEMLQNVMELMDPEEIKGLTGREFERYCKAKAEYVYTSYHQAIPGLKPTSRAATNKVLRRGYVLSAYGRRLHMPPKAAHMAFNRIVQGTAADIVKEATVALSPRYNEFIRSRGIHLVASVHDETLMEGEEAVLRNPETIRHIVSIMETANPSFRPLRVPLRTSIAVSSGSWASCEENKLDQVD